MKPSVNTKPIDIIRTLTIIAGIVWYAMTAWSDVRDLNNFGYVLLGQVLLILALILSIMDNFGYTPKLRESIRVKLIRFFDWIEGV